jgi:hypothetical protein
VLARKWRGLPKYPQDVQDIAFCGLDCGLKKERLDPALCELFGSPSYPREPFRKACKRRRVRNRRQEDMHCNEKSKCQDKRHLTLCRRHSKNRSTAQPNLQIHLRNMAGTPRLQLGTSAVTAQLFGNCLKLRGTDGYQNRALEPHVTIIGP